MVWPALLPPWLRTITSALVVSTSMILPLPSSPHCAPTRIVFAISIQTQAKIFPTHLARRSRDLPTNDKNGLPSRKRFSRNEVLEKGNQALNRLRSLGYADHSTDYSDPIVA